MTIIKNARIELKLSEIKSLAFYEGGNRSIGLPIVEIYLNNATITKKVKGFKEAERLFKYYGFDIHK